VIAGHGRAGAWPQAIDAEERYLSDGLARERAAFFELFDTDDQAEGMAAFTQKRPPAWSGH
jgi:enoyl-CoA hydratase/carnithine racemase